MDENLPIDIHYNKLQGAQSLLSNIKSEVFTNFVSYFEQIGSLVAGIAKRTGKSLF